MGTTFKPLYGADAAITITSLNSLANNGAAGGLAVDNSTTLAEDALVSAVIATGASVGATANANIAVIYAYGSTDGTNYSDGVTGADAAQTLTSPPNLRTIGVVATPAASTTYRGGPFSVARAFGGVLPKKWGIVVVNGSGGAFASSGGSADYQPINEQIP